MLRSVFTPLTLSFLVFCCSYGIAQVPAAAPSAKVAETTAKAPTPDLSQDDVVVEKMREKIAFESDGTHTSTHYQRARVQSEAGVQSYGRIMVPFTSRDIVKFDFVKVIKPDGKVLNVGFDDMQEIPAPITQQAPMYSDDRVKHLPIPNLRPGDILEFQFTTRNIRPLIPGQFWLELKHPKDYIVLDSSLEASWPSSKPVIIRISDKFKPDISESNGRKSYTLHYRNLTIPDSAKKDPVEDPDEANRPDIFLTSFASWKELGSFFSGIFAERAKTDDEITAKALALIKDKQTDDDKINAIYRYVAQEYRYISISLGIGRYQPHTAEAIFTNHFGDCKDKHTLLATMLAAAGFKAYPLLINGSGRKLNPDVPSPSQFDHVITAVDRGGKWQFLDSTPELAPAGELIPLIRGVKGLLAGGPHTGDLLETPANPPFPLHREMTVDAQVNDIGKLTAKIHYSIRDDSELFLRQAFNDTPRNKWKDVMQQLSYSMSYTGDIDNVVVSDPLKLSEPFTFSYDYSHEDYLTWNGRVEDIQLPLPPIMNTSAADDAPATKPFDLGSPRELTLSASVVFPKTALALPPSPVDLVRDFAEYHSVYKAEGGVLQVRRSLKVKVDAPPGELESYRAFCHAIADDYSTKLRVFRSPDEAIAAPASSSPEELQAAAEQAMQRGDLKSVISLAGQLVEKKPDSPDGWAMLADAEMGILKVDDAIRHYRKQLDLNPQQERAAIGLGLASSAAGKHDEAIAELQGHIQSSPSDKSAIAALGHAYFNAKRYSLAIPQLQKALESNSGNSSLELTLAECYMATKDAKAMPLLESLIAQNRQNASGSNNVAYTMATYGYELPTALKWAREYSQSLEARTQKDEAFHYLSAPPRDYDSIAAVWDTIGYIYFLQQDYTRAVDYLKGSWTLQPDRTVGEHLANAFAKQGDIKNEQHIRKLVQGVPPSPQNVSEAYELSKHPAFTADASIVDELQNMRTIRLPEKSREFRSAEYVVSIDNTGHAKKLLLAFDSDLPQDVITSLKTMHYPLHIPAGTNAKIIRRGSLSCSPYTGCMFVLQQNRMPATVKTVHPSSAKAIPSKAAREN